MSVRPRRVVFVSPYGHHGAPSGARHRVESLCKALQTHSSIQVSCMSPWVPPAGVEHIVFTLEGSVIQRLISIGKLSGRLASLQPDLVISESPIAPLSFGRYRLLHLIHDAKFVTAHARRGARVTRGLHSMSARLADAVVTVSHAERERLCKALRLRQERVMVSYNGLSDAWFTTPLPEANSPRPYDLLYVSNFAPHKGHMALLQALKGKAWRVAFVGADFGELQACKRKAAEWDIEATFFSNLSEEALIATYDNARAFVFPSQLEGFGIPYLEARARGLPVLAHDIPVFQELQSLVGGEIADFTDVDGIAGRIALLLQQPIGTGDLQQFRWSNIAFELLNFEHVVS